MISCDHFHLSFCTTQLCSLGVAAILFVLGVRINVTVVTLLVATDFRPSHQVAVIPIFCPVFTRFSLFTIT